MRRETPGRQAEYEEANRRKYIRFFKETRQWWEYGTIRFALTFVTELFTFGTCPLPSEQVRDPIMDMNEYHRPRAIWLRRQKKTAPAFRNNVTPRYICAERKHPTRNGVEYFRKV